MSDRFFACMEIGGKLKRSDVPEFIKVLKESGVTTYDNDTSIEHMTTEEELMGLVKGTLRVQDPEAPYGTIYALPEACKKLGLSYDHASDAAYEYDGETNYVRDGKDVGFNYSSQSGDSFIMVRELQEEFGHTFGKMVECTPQEIRQAMIRHAKLDIDPLPNFEIVD